MTNKQASQYRQYVRSQVSRPQGELIEVTVGSAAPHYEGETSHHVNASGHLVRHPNAYRKAFGKPIYVASTYRIVVGEKWLTKRRIPIEAMEAGKDVSSVPVIAGMRA
jgi:hypothetical protein